MRRVLTLTLVILAGSLLSDPTHRDATWLIAQEQQQVQEQEQEQLPPPPDIDPSDPKRPWHRGSTHFGCSRDGKSHDGHESDAQVAQWHKCNCQHSCTDPSNKETGGRRWSRRCFRALRREALSLPVATVSNITEGTKGASKWELRTITAGTS